MNLYELSQNTKAGTRVLGAVTAGTLPQAKRKLYRAHNVPQGNAQALGYTVQYAAKQHQPQKASNAS